MEEAYLDQEKVITSIFSILTWAMGIGNVINAKIVDHNDMIYWILDQRSSNLCSILWPTSFVRLLRQNDFVHPMFLSMTAGQVLHIVHIDVHLDFRGKMTKTRTKNCGCSYCWYLASAGSLHIPLASFPLAQGIWSWGENKNKWNQQRCLISNMM